MFAAFTEYVILILFIQLEHKNKLFREAMRVLGVTFTVHNMNNPIKLNYGPMFHEFSRVNEK